MEKTAAAREEPVRLRLGPIALEGGLTLPEAARGIIVFAHGSGSSRRSPRNRRVARVLNEAGFATLLVDLLTPEEEERDRLGGRLRFDVRLLAGRLAGAMDWVRTHASVKELGMGCFGASTGAAAALIAAAERPPMIEAVVSRGGRPDLAWESLPRVRAPTLLIVGGNDEEVVRFNREALARIPADKELCVIPGAAHLFEEPGALEEVAAAARLWFHTYLKTPNREPPLETRINGI